MDKASINKKFDTPISTNKEREKQLDREFGLVLMLAGLETQIKEALKELGAIFDYINEQ